MLSDREKKSSVWMTILRQKGNVHHMGDLKVIATQVILCNTHISSDKIAIRIDIRYIRYIYIADLRAAYPFNMTDD